MCAVWLDRLINTRQNTYLNYKVKSYNMFDKFSAINSLLNNVKIISRFFDGENYSCYCRLIMNEFISRKKKWNCWAFELDIQFQFNSHIKLWIKMCFLSFSQHIK